MKDAAKDDCMRGHGCLMLLRTFTSSRLSKHRERISQYCIISSITHNMSTLPPLSRPEPRTRKPGFLSVNAEERATFDLTAKASFNVLYQDCKNILPIPFELPAPNTFRQIDDGFPRERKVHQLCKTGADGCHLCTLLLIKIPDIIAGPSKYNRWKDETLVSLKVRHTADAFIPRPIHEDQDELIVTHEGVQEAHHDLTLNMTLSTASEPQELPC
jgi:hypothetical protein